MLADYDFHKIGRAAYKENPLFFSLLDKRVRDLQDNSITDLTLINSYFHYFCLYKDLQPEHVRQVMKRSNVELISIRRLFIAIVLKQFDKLYLEDIAGRMADKLRLRISDCLNCNEVWVSVVSPSVKTELKKLSGYNKEVSGIITAIEPYITNPLIDVPEYVSTRSGHQLQMFG